VHLIDFPTKKFVTMHGHMHVKRNSPTCSWSVVYGTDFTL